MSEPQAICAKDGRVIAYIVPAGIAGEQVVDANGERIGFFLEGLSGEYSTVENDTMTTHPTRLAAIQWLLRERMPRLPWTWKSGLALALTIAVLLVVQVVVYFPW